MEEPDWPAQRSDLHNIRHLGDELERQLRARPYHPTSVYILSTAVAGCEKPRSGGCYSSILLPPLGRLCCYVCCEMYGMALEEVCALRVPL